MPDLLRSAKLTDWAAEIAADGPYSSQQRILSPGLLESSSAVEGSLELPPTLSSRGPCDPVCPFMMPRSAWLAVARGNYALTEKSNARAFGWSASGVRGRLSQLFHFHFVPAGFRLVHHRHINHNSSRYAP